MKIECYESNKVFTFKSSNNKIYAKIFFQTHPVDNEWQFAFCDYKLSGKYTLEEWGALKELAEEIIKLNDKCKEWK